MINNGETKNKTAPKHVKYQKCSQYISRTKRKWRKTYDNDNDSNWNDNTDSSSWNVSTALSEKTIFDERSTTRNSN